jgi:hypothetical protein
MMVEEHNIIDKHLLVEVLKICHIGGTKVDCVEMLDATIALEDIVDRVPDTYNTNEGWVEKEKESKIYQ